VTTARQGHRGLAEFEQFIFQHAIDTIGIELDHISAIEKLEGKKPLTVVTGARLEGHGDESALAHKAILDQTPILLLFGTGWGLLASTTDQADFRLGPITSCAQDDYNHLSVRSAVAIYVDRLARSLCSP
jgi:hypothetical protein